jgi:hypothetical protein
VEPVQEFLGIAQDGVDGLAGLPKPDQSLRLLLPAGPPHRLADRGDEVNLELLRRL